MTVVFAQGMRRSGTTILFDLLWDDGAFRCFYEPLNRIRPARGGGSKARDTDYMEPVAAFRTRFLARRGDPTLSQDDLNWGAPRDAGLEFDGGWPDHVRDFVAAMAASAPDVFVKFTRASHKVRELGALRPDAFFLHLVRDPRSVATSHLFGTRPEQRERIVAEDSFFRLTTGFDQWRSETMARILAERKPEYAWTLREPAFVRVLAVWKELYTATRDGARAAFPGRHALVLHEALCADPTGVLRSVHRVWGGEPSPSVLDWARENVRPARPWHAAGDPRWDAACERLGLPELVREAESATLRG